MRLLIAAAVVLSAALAQGGDALSAGPSVEATRLATVVAHVGPTRAITVGDVEARVSALPLIQRAAMGSTPDAIRHAVLDVMVREALLAAGAEGLEHRLPTSYAVDRAVSNAAIRAIRARVGPASAISMADVQAFYEAHRERYESPVRYQLWRILCKTRDEAQTVLEQALKDATPKAFADLAREHSIDMATRLRSGNLGFIAEDGTSNEPGLRVDPALAQAAATVADGQLVPRPIPEQGSFAVVWRRGTLAASKRTVEAAASQIRETLQRERVKQETDAVLARLRSEKVRDLDETRLDSVELDATSPRADR